jgi:hypothetical protein
VVAGERVVYSNCIAESDRLIILEPLKGRKEGRKEGRSVDLNLVLASYY